MAAPRLSFAERTPSFHPYDWELIPTALLSHLQILTVEDSFSFNLMDKTES